jgi:adenosylhomocysteine nucleosidase
MPITRLHRGPRTAAEAGRALICAAFALEAELIERQFERESWEPEVADLSEFIGRVAKDGCRRIVSYGVSGALCPDLRSGDIVVGSEVVAPSGNISTDDIWSAWLLSAIPTAVYGPIVGIDIPVTASASRGDLRIRSGALAADMESHVIAQLAAANALRFVALRVVIDGVGRNVSPTALACVSSHGEISRWRLSRMLLERPCDTLDVLRLSADWLLARKALQYCSDVLGASVHAIEL